MQFPTPNQPLAHWMRTSRLPPAVPRTQTRWFRRASIRCQTAEDETSGPGSALASSAATVNRVRASLRKKKRVSAAFFLERTEIDECRCLSGWLPSFEARRSFENAPRLTSRFSRFYLLGRLAIPVEWQAVEDLGYGFHRSTRFFRRIPISDGPARLDEVFVAWFTVWAFHESYSVDQFRKMKSPIRCITSPTNNAGPRRRSVWVETTTGTTQ